MKKCCCLILPVALLCLTGCGDYQSQKNVEELARKVHALNLRMDAVEDICRQLHARLAAIENRGGIAQAEVSENGTLIAAENTLRTDASFTQSEIRSRIIGMTPQKIQKTFGAPTKVKESSVSLSWDYDSIAFKLADGTPSASAMLVVFENGEATQVIFHENVEYKSE